MRLQTECPPGGVCVSRAVRDQVRGRVGQAFESIGPLKLTNITQPVEAFALRFLAATADRPIASALAHGTNALPLPDKPSIAVLAFTT